MFSAHSRGRTESRGEEGESSQDIRQNSRAGPRYASIPEHWESCYVDTFDDEDNENDYTTSTPSPPARRNCPAVFTNPWGQPRPRSRSRQRRTSHIRTSGWDGDASPVSPTTTSDYPRASTIRGRSDSQSRRHSTAEGVYRSNSRNSRGQRRWERDYIRVFDKEYAEDNNTHRRHTHPRPRPAPTPDLRMSGALPVPSESSSSSRPSRLSRHERQEQRARTAEWAAEDERGRASRSQNNGDSDSELAEALEESLRTFEEEKGRRRKRQSLTPWYRRRGVGNSVDEALRERVARSVDEQNREIARRMGAKGERSGSGSGEGRRRVRRVRFPDEE